MTARDQPIKVLLVSPVGEHGGAEQVLLALGRHLPELGVEPVLACMRPGPLVDLARGRGLPVYAYRDHRYRHVHRLFGGIRWLSRLIRRERVELVHSNLSAHLYGSPAARLTRVPELWHIHDFPHRRNRLEQACLRLPADFALFTTRRVADGFPQLLGRPHEVVHPVSFDPDALRLASPRNNVREEYALPEGPLLLTVGRLQEHKGHRYLVEAVPDVLRASPDAVCAIVGRATGREQEKYRIELEARCDELGITQNVFFLGYVPDVDLAALYREAFALVHPALTESFGLTLLEAMSFGVPLIAAASDGPREIVVARETGLLTTPANSRELADAIIQLLKSPELAATLGREGRLRALSFTSAQMALEVAAIYRRMLVISPAT